MVNAPEVNKADPAAEKKEEEKSQSNGHHKTEQNGAEGSPEPEPTAESANELLAKGRRDIICNNIPQAVTTLSEACAQFDKVFGEGHVKCAKSYYWYGNALLDLARLENGVLGNVLQGVPTGDTPQKPKSNGVHSGEEVSEGVVVEDPDTLTEEEKDKVREQVGDAMEEAAAAVDDQEAEGETGEKEDSADATEGADETEVPTSEVKADEDEKTEEAAVEYEANKENEVQGAADGENGGEEVADETLDDDDAKDAEEDDEEDEDSLKFSWEMLDVARKILEKATDEEIEGRTDLLGQCFLKLGENLMECSHHSEAEVEFKKSIEVYEAAAAALPVDDEARRLHERSLAESFFMAGNNLSMANNFTNAVNQYESAIRVVKGTMASVNRVMASLSGESEEVTKRKEELNGELRDMKDFLPMMEEKLQDARQCHEKVLKDEASGVGSEVRASGEKSALQEAMREVEMKEAQLGGGSGGAVDSAPAKSINHLVKRKSPLKEKPVVNQEEDDTAAKRKAEVSSDAETAPAKKAKIEDNATQKSALSS